MGTYEWRNPAWLKEAVKTGELPNIRFSTDSSALGNMVRSGFDIETSANDNNFQEAKKVINGKKYDIFANGKKLDTSKIRLVEGFKNYYGELEISEWNNLNGDEIVSKITGSNKEIVPSNSRVHTVKDLFQVTGVNNLSLKPVSNSEPANTTNKNNTMETDEIKDMVMSKKGIAVAVAGIIGFMVLR